MHLTLAKEPGPSRAVATARGSGAAGWHERQRYRATAARPTMTLGGETPQVAMALSGPSGGDGISGGATQVATALGGGASRAATALAADRARRLRINDELLHVANPFSSPPSVIPFSSPLSARSGSTADLSSSSSCSPLPCPLRDVVGAASSFASPLTFAGQGAPRRRRGVEGFRATVNLP